MIARMIGPHLESKLINASIFDDLWGTLLTAVPFLVRREVRLELIPKPVVVALLTLRS